MQPEELVVCNGTIKTGKTEGIDEPARCRDVLRSSRPSNFGATRVPYCYKEVDHCSKTLGKFWFDKLKLQHIVATY